MDISTITVDNFIVVSMEALFTYIITYFITSLSTPLPVAANLKHLGCTQSLGGGILLVTLVNWTKLVIIGHVTDVTCHMSMT